MRKLKAPVIWITALGLSLMTLLVFLVKQNVFAAQENSFLRKSLTKDFASETNAGIKQNVFQSSFADEIQSLIDKWQGSALVGEGWLHLVEFHDRNKDQIGKLPNGEEIPMDYISDTWYHLSEDGEIVALVAMMKDTNENIVQIGTYFDGLWRNVTMGEEWAGEADEVGLDYGFIKDIGNSEFYGSIVSREENAADGNQEIVFSITDIFHSPTKIEGFDMLIAKGVKQISFDQQSGAISFIERFLVDEYGNERLLERMKISLIEKIASPPPEVLDYLLGS